jgi:hypothetical protein
MVGGRGRFMAVYVAGALVGTTASFLLTPAPSVGASGAAAAAAAAAGRGRERGARRAAGGGMGRAHLASCCTPPRCAERPPPLPPSTHTAAALPCALPPFPSPAALFGLGAALGVFYYRHRDLLGERSDSVLRQLGLTLAINAAYSLANRRVDNWWAGAGGTGRAACAQTVGASCAGQRLLAAAGSHDCALLPPR